MAIEFNKFNNSYNNYNILATSLDYYANEADACKWSYDPWEETI